MLICFMLWFFISSHLIGKHYIYNFAMIVDNNKPKQASNYYFVFVLYGICT